MARRRTPLLAMAAGAVAGGVVAAALLAAGWAPGRDDPFRTDPAAVREFLAAWRRSREATFVLETRFVRTVEGRSGISTTREVVQRPPDRIVRQGGSVDARVDGRRVSCATGPDGKTQCRDLGRAPPYDDEVDREIDTLAGYVRAARRPPYFVDRIGGCFRLRLAVELPPALRTYGETARFCFDGATGALLRSVVERTNGRDVTEVVDVRPLVRNADLRLPEEPGKTG